MNNYSVSGDFGEIKFYTTAILPDYVESLDQIRIAGWHRVNSLYRVSRPNGCDFSLIIATLSGSGSVRIGKKQYTAKPGTICIIPYDCASEYMANGQELWEFQWLHYSGIRAESCTRDIGRTGKYLCDVGLNEVNHFFMPFENTSLKGLDKAFAHSEALDNILHCVLKNNLLTSQSDYHPQIADEMVDYIEHREDFSLDDLVSKYYFSKEYLIRLFKKKTGYTPYKYWKTYRLKKSFEELETSEKSIKEISQALGYRNPGHYITQFKKHMGITPARYRESFMMFKK